MIRIERISSWDRLLHVAGAWTELAGDAVFCSWPWLGPWWRHYGQRSRLYVLAGWDDAGRLAALAPWRLDLSAARGRVVRFLGDNEVCTDYLTLLARPEAAAAAVAALAQWLVDAEGEDRWDLMEWSGVAAADRRMKGLAEALAERGCAAAASAAPSCWRMPLAADWEAWLASRTKRCRRNFRRVLRRLVDTGRAATHVAGDGPELEHGFQLLVELHQKRWRREGRPGCFASPLFRSFLWDVVQLHAHRGQVRLLWIELDGRPAAAELHLIGGRVAYAYQSGMDPDRRTEYPGVLAQAEAIRLAIRERRRAVDMLRGDEPYKARWGAEAVPQVRWRIAAPRRLAQVRHGALLAGGAMKQWLKAGWGLVGSE